MEIEGQRHEPVLLQEAIEALRLKDGYKVIDCTLGLGGHTALILKKIGKRGKVLAIDRDQEALEIAKQKLCSFKNQITFFHGNFTDLRKIAKDHGFLDSQALLADLGMSSYQLNLPYRGFSWDSDGPLDMRMDSSLELTAADLVNDASEEELRRIFRDYGEVTFAKKLAFEIKIKRKNKKITTTKELSRIVELLISPKLKNKKRPISQVFQALRIKVNDELGALARMLDSLSSILVSGARVGVITFHSLEDRIIKEFFKEQSSSCDCPLESPVCNCDKEPTFKVISRKPVFPSEGELKRNPRARSAKLRVYEKI